MSTAIQTDVPPIRVDATGAWRVGDTRLLVEIVVQAFQDGATPEAIVQRYPPATLAEVYGVVAYYLRHPEVVNEYISEREKLAASVQTKIESGQSDMTDLRRRLSAIANR